MRFLVVAPRYIERPGTLYAFPLGLAYVSAVLKKEGHEVRCLNLNHREEAVATLVQREIIEKNIDVLCTGGLSAHYRKIRVILEAARAARPGIITILGGGIVSSDPELIMRHLRPTYGVIGEGEETVAELAAALVHGHDPARIKGLCSLDSSDTVAVTPSRSAIADVDAIPYPDYDGFEIETYLGMQTANDGFHMYPFDRPRMIPIIASRSCPYRCTFCYHPIGNKYRQRSLAGFFAELDQLVGKYQVNMITVVDELFAMDGARIREFCDRIKPYNLKFLAQMRVDSVDRETLALLRAAGCYLIGYGLESASDIILQSMKKHTTVAQVEKALNLTYEAGIGIQGNFLFGDPAETRETIEETTGWWERHRKYAVNLTPLLVFPGSEIYNHARERGVIGDPLAYLEGDCQPINITRMSDAEYHRMASTIYTLTADNPLPARVLSCRNTGSDPYKGELYAIEVVCPHCGEASTYNSMHQSANRMFPLGCRIGCRVCNQRFDILPFKLYEYLQREEAPAREETAFARSRRVAIYGAGLAGSVAHEYCRRRGKKVLYFIDDFKEGEWCGLPIVRPESIREDQKPELTVFAVNAWRFLAGMLEKMKNWRASGTFLYAQTISPHCINVVEDEAVLAYYLEYYQNTWLPLLAAGNTKKHQGQEWGAGNGGEDVSCP